MSASLPDPRRWLALVVLLAGAFLPAFDFFVVNVALPSLQSELGARPAQLQFVVAGYSIGFAVLLVTGGRLGDLYGRKRMFMFGMAGFTIASALCGLAPTPNVLIAARVLQGLTAAVMNPQVLAIIRVTFLEGERARAIGYFGTTLGLASIAAQLVGGALIQADFAGLSWRPIFLVNVPIGAAALIAATRLIRESRATGRPSIDLGGIAIGSLALMLLIYPLVEGREAGWPLWAWVALLLAPPAFVWFILFELSLQHRGRAPLVSMRLFRDPGFSLGLMMAVTFFGGLAAFFMTLTVVLQDGLGFDPLATGIVFVAFGLGFVAGSMLSAWVARRLGPRTISLGTLMMAIGLVGVIVLFRARHGGAPNEWLLWPVLIFYGAGQGFALPTLVASVVGSSRIPPQEAGAASGVFSMIQQVAFTLGIAVIVGVFFSRLGATPDAAAYEAALSIALACNAGLMLVTCALAFALPRGRVVATPSIHLD
jgi:MFS family permease